MEVCDGWEDDASWWGGGSLPQGQEAVAHARDLMIGKIVSIDFVGFTFEVHAEVNGVPVTFFTTHPHEEELRYHLKKQWEMVSKCKRISDDYMDRYKDQIGKEFIFDV